MPVQVILCIFLRCLDLIKVSACDGRDLLSDILGGSGCGEIYDQYALALRLILFLRLF